MRPWSVQTAIFTTCRAIPAALSAAAGSTWPGRRLRSSRRGLRPGAKRSAEVAAALDPCFRPNRLRSAASRGRRPAEPGPVADGCPFADGRARLGAVVFGQCGPGAQLFCSLAGTVAAGLFRWGSLLAGVALYAALCVHGISIADLLCRPARRAK